MGINDKRCQPDISLSCIMTRLRCCGIFNDESITYLLQLKLEIFVKELIIWQSYEQEYSDFFFVQVYCTALYFERCNKICLKTKKIAQDHQCSVRSDNLVENSYKQFTVKCCNKRITLPVIISLAVNH